MSNTVKFHYDHSYNLSPLNCGRFYLYQVGDLCCQPGFLVPEHPQTSYEISLIESGKAVFLIDGQELPVKKSDLILNRAGEQHAIQSSVDDPVRFFYFAITFNEESPDYKKFEEIKNFFDKTENRIATDNLDLHSVFYKIFSEMKISDPFFLEMIEANLTQLLVMSYRNLLKISVPRYNPQLNIHAEEDLVYEVINLIDSGRYSIKNLGEIGKEVGYSYPYLSQLFSKKVNRSIMEYFQQHMFEKALTMLDDGISITKIAEELGYKSIHSFSRAFSNYYGYPPSKHKAIATQEEEK